MKAIAIIIATLAFASQMSAQIPYGGPVTPLSPEIINPENGHIYLLLSPGNWTDSEAAAVALGGHLATIRNQAEEDWVYRIFWGYAAQPHALWIGLHAVNQPNHFVWASGARVTYTDWAPQQPFNQNGLEAYVALIGTWYCLPDTTSDAVGQPCNGVVEIVRERQHWPDGH